MTVRTCLFIPGAGGSPDYFGEDDRSWIAAFLGGRNFEAIAPGQGAVGTGHGILSAGSMAVTQSSPTGAAVLVASGLAAVRGTTSNNQGVYVCPLDATERLTISAKSATTGQNRRDLVVARVRDNQYGVAGNVWAPEIVAGATSGSPSDPAVPDDTLVLARVAVNGGAGSTTIVDANITDLRPHCRATGAITPVATAAAWPSPQDYDVIWDISTSKLQIYFSGQWNTIGVDYNQAWTAYTPTFTNITVGNGTRYGRYRKIGRLVLFEAGIELGTTSSVGGPITVSLPGGNAASPGSNTQYLAIGRGTPSGARWGCIGALDPTNDATRYVNFATAGQAPWTTGVPAAWTTGNIFSCFGAYEAASP